jgi:hypothetical protein
LESNKAAKGVKCNHRKWLIARKNIDCRSIESQQESQRGVIRSFNKETNSLPLL